MAKKKILLNKTETAQMMGITVRSFSEWEIKPEKKRGNQVFYDLKKVIKYYRDKNEKKINLISHERARLLKIQSEKAEIELKELEGKLINSDIIEIIWKDQIISFRSKLLSLPNKISLQLSKITSAKKIKSLISDNIHNILEELSDYKTPINTIKKELKKIKRN